jgi:hypothetical protein
MLNRIIRENPAYDGYYRTGLIQNASLSRLSLMVKQSRFFNVTVSAQPGTGQVYQNHLMNPVQQTQLERYYIRYSICHRFFTNSAQRWFNRQNAAFPIIMNGVFKRSCYTEFHQSGSCTRDYRSDSIRRTGTSNALPYIVFLLLM